MNLIAIDPGRTTGWALFKADRLFKAGKFERTEFGAKGLVSPLDFFIKDCNVLVELPRWYPHDQKDVNDLIDLAVQVGEIRYCYESLGCTVELVWPRTWKGNVKKEIMTERILSRLTPEELALVPRRPRAKTPDHNCVDAIGLGLWKLGRLR